MLSLREIHTYYGNIRALKGVSLDVSRGEIITLLGANGAGKTTTLMSISGIHPPRSGEILFEGENIVDLAPEKIVARFGTAPTKVKVSSVFGKATSKVTKP